MAYGEIRRTQVSARMLPSTGSIAGGTMGLQFRADGKLLVVPAFNRPLVDAGASSLVDSEMRRASVWSAPDRQ